MAGELLIFAGLYFQKTIPEKHENLSPSKVRTFTVFKLSYNYGFLTKSLKAIIVYNLDFSFQNCTNITKFSYENISSVEVTERKREVHGHCLQATSRELFLVFVSQTQNFQRI